MKNIENRRTSPNGVFGSKLFTANLRSIALSFPTALASLEADILINIRRRDIIAQAVSYHLGGNGAAQSRIIEPAQREQRALNALASGDIWVPTRRGSGMAAFDRDSAEQTFLGISVEDELRLPQERS